MENGNSPAPNQRAAKPSARQGSFPPPGLVDREEACRMFGVSPRTWAQWVQNGRVNFGQRHQRPSDGNYCVLYPRAELQRLRDQLEQVGKPYLDPDRPGVVLVPLNSSRVRREVLIDEQDLSIVEGKSRCWAERSDGKGGTVILTIGGRQKHLHRLIAAAMGITGPAARISFANGDALDCRRQNLVVRTSAEVIHAARPTAARAGKPCASKFKGVAFDRRCGKWRATIRRGGLITTIGEFDTEQAAAEAYDDCAHVWYGEHAYLNVPDRPLTSERRIWAQGVQDRAIERERRRRRRVMKLGRLLKRNAEAATSELNALPMDGPTIGRLEARKLLGVSRGKWRRWEKRGWIPKARRVDGRSVYPLALIKRLLEWCGRLRPPYPDPQRANVWRVPLAFSGKRNEVLIDESSLSLIEGGWCVMGGMRAETGADAYVSLWSPTTKDHRPLRRLITGVTEDGLQVGHRNDDPMDCRRENLVVLTAAERSYRNRKIKSINGKPVTSKFKGVSWSKGGKKWVAMIHGGGKARYLGLYVKEEEAAIVYDRAARELFGEHARLNFPDDADEGLGRAAA